MSSRQSYYPPAPSIDLRAALDDHLSVRGLDSCDRTPQHSSQPIFTHPPYYSGMSSYAGLLPPEPQRHYTQLEFESPAIYGRAVGLPGQLSASPRLYPPTFSSSGKSANGEGEELFMASTSRSRQATGSSQRPTVSAPKRKKERQGSQNEHLLSLPSYPPTDLPPTPYSGQSPFHRPQRPLNVFASQLHRLPDLEVDKLLRSNSERALTNSTLEGVSIHRTSSRSPYVNPSPSDIPVSSASYTSHSASSSSNYGLGVVVASDSPPLSFRY